MPVIWDPVHDYEFMRAVREKGEAIRKGLQPRAA
jgi:hypothetical protein